MYELVREPNLQQYRNVYAVSYLDVRFAAVLSVLFGVTLVLASCSKEICSVGKCLHVPLLGAAIVRMIVPSEFKIPPRRNT